MYLSVILHAILEIGTCRAAPFGMRQGTTGKEGKTGLANQAIAPACALFLPFLPVAA